MMTISTKMVQYGLLLVALVNYVQAECPNACSGHGDCGNFDQCNCWRNWMANDCSERICPFALAHVDLPKGDLDHDNTISKSTFVSNKWTKADTAKYHPMYYTTGTAEKFPHMGYESTAASTTDAKFNDAGHFYAECANKGLCDRSSGECECFESYEGTACQRASCPNKCSGHGTCESIRELADKDYSNIYELWDRDATYGCDCDAGYYGADCSLRYCKMGVDPLYFDDEATIRTNSWYIHIDGTAATDFGTFGLKFYDVFDEDYVTEPVVFQTAASAADGELGAADREGLKNALLGLPNSVIESMTFKHYGDATDAYYLITFTGNPGTAKTPEIDLYLNGNYGPTSSTMQGTATFTLTAGGLSGEFKDYFYSRCEGVEVKVVDNADNTVGANIIGGSATLTVDAVAADGGSQLDKLKKCLGDSNGETSDNVGIYNWDTGALTFKFGDGSAAQTGYGVGQYPHAIKLVEKSPGTEYEGGHFYITYLTSDYNKDGTADDDKFYLLSRLYKGDGAVSGTTDFYVYTTDAVVKLVYVSATANPYNYGLMQSDATKDGFGGTGTSSANDKNDEFPIYAYWTKDTTLVYTSYDASCEYMNSYADDAAGSYGDATNNRYVYPCLQKGDYIMLPDGGWGDYTATSGVTFQADGAGTAAGTIDAHMDAINIGFVTGGVTGTVAGFNTVQKDYSGHIYEIMKIWTAPYSSGTTAAEDRFRITVDKPIPWDGSTKAVAAYTSAPSFPVSTRHGITPIFKFDVATVTDDGNTPTYFEYVSECSNKGICNADTAICECFKGYTGAACETQSAFAM